jgi:hypothetical protein
MGEIIHAIAQYGIVPTVIGALIYLLFLLHSRRQELKREKEDAENERKRSAQEAENERRRKELDIENQKHLINAFTELLKDFKEPKHTVEEQRENRNTNEFVARQLNCLIEEGCDRAYMFSFHNGGKDVLGRGFLKMSMTQEAVDEDVVPIMIKYQNMPRMLFPKLYEQLDEKDYYNIDDLESIKKTDPFTYQFMIEHGAKIAMFRAIKREDGLMVGFVGMEYINSTCEDKKKAGKNIDKKVNRIIGALLGQNN